MNILIVEDHELTRFGLKTTFEGVDYIETIFEAESAEKAIEIFNNNKDLLYTNPVKKTAENKIFDPIL